MDEKKEKIEEEKERVDGEMEGKGDRKKGRKVGGCEERGEKEEKAKGGVEGLIE